MNPFIPSATLLLDGEGEVLQEVPLAEPFVIATDIGDLTIDSLLDMTPDEIMAWAADPAVSYDQQAAMLSLLNDPAIQMYARLRRFRDDPIGFVRQVLRMFPWSIQGEVMESVRDNRRTSVPSCHAAGKSFIAACIVLWWISTHAPGDAFVVTTAPTFSQVHSILWRYINRMHNPAIMPGRTNQSQWYIGRELVAIGRKPADTNPSAFQGLHAKYALILVDEADGVHSNIYGALQTLITTEHCRELAIGNPDTNSGRFYDANLPGSDWHSIRIAAWDTPNFNGHPKRERPDEIGVPRAVAENLIDQAFVDDIANDPHYGEESAYYASKVDALAPTDNPRSVMSLARLRDCMPHRDLLDRELRFDPETLQLLAGHDLAPVEIGLDVGGGGDLTVARERRGHVLGRVLRIKSDDPAKQWQQIIKFINLCGATVIKVDVIGVGWGVAGALDEAKKAGAHSARVVKVNVGRSGRKATPRRPGFPKLRDQLWWEVGRINTLEQQWDLSGLYDEEWVLPELFQPTYQELVNGQTKVMEKAEMKKLLGHSPDDADAILLAFAKIQSPASSRGYEQMLAARIG